MARKAYLEVELEVMVPVKVTVELVVRADENASLQKIVNLWAKGKRSPKGEVEDTRVANVFEVGGYETQPVDLASDLDTAIDDMLGSGAGEVKVIGVTVTGSRLLA